MSKAIDNLQAAQQRAMAGRPKVGGFPYLAETLRRSGVSAQSLVPALMSEPVSDRAWAGCDPGHAAGIRHGGCAANSTGRHSSQRYEPTRPGGARSRSSLPRPGALGLSAMMSTSRRVPLPTTAVMARSISKPILASR